MKRDGKPVARKALARLRLPAGCPRNLRGLQARSLPHGAGVSPARLEAGPTRLGAEPPGASRARAVLLAPPRAVGVGQGSAPAGCKALRSTRWLRGISGEDEHGTSCPRIVRAAATAALALLSAAGAVSAGRETATPQQQRGQERTVRGLLARRGEGSYGPVRDDPGAAPFWLRNTSALTMATGPCAARPVLGP